MGGNAPTSVGKKVKSVEKQNKQERHAIQKKLRNHGTYKGYYKMEDEMKARQRLAWLKKHPHEK